jgi:predicted O-methyltransferase YrrM
MDLFENLSSEGIVSNPVAFRKQVEAIGKFVDANRFSRTLETGLGIGGSASYILSSTGGIHVAMDPFQKDGYNNKGLENLRKFGLLDRLDFHQDFSFHVLPKLILEGRKFDFIYIDGDHKFDVALIDFYYSDILLDIGGYLLLDDTWMHSLMAVDRFIETNRSREYRKMEEIYEAGSLYQKINQIQGNATSQYRVF